MCIAGSDSSVLGCVLWANVRLPQFVRESIAGCSSALHYELLMCLSQSGAMEATLVAIKAVPGRAFSPDVIRGDALPAQVWLSG